MWPQLPIPRAHDLWPVCLESECIAVQVAGYDRCLAHLAKVNRDESLSQLSPGANVDARGTVFTSVLLRELLEAVKNPETGRSHFGSADFTSAEFREAAWFGDVEFTESGGGAVRWVSSSSAMSRSIAAAKFVGAEFSGDVSFVGAQFEVGR